MKPQQKRVTLHDVAKHAGVSRATASLIVRNSPKVAEKTKKRVLESMHELGYVYDRVAANLRSQSSKTIGIIITDIGNSFFSQLLLGVHQELERHGYTVLLGTTFNSLTNQKQLISTMLENRVGGIILCPVPNSSIETVEWVNKLDVPIVLGVRELHDLTCDYVGLDYISGSYKATSYLINDKKHYRIAFIGGHAGSSTWEDRFKGFKKAHEEARINVDSTLIVQSDPTRAGGHEAILKLMSLKDRPEAIFCFNDVVAFGAIIALRKSGFTPGQDIDVVGFDNIPEAEISYPSLTTISSFAQEIGVQAARLLHQRISEPETELQRVLLEPELVKRESS